MKYVSLTLSSSLFDIIINIILRIIINIILMIVISMSYMTEHCYYNLYKS